MNKSIFKIGVIILLSLFLRNVAFAQKKKSDLMPNSQIRISLSTVCYDGLYFSHHGKKLLKSLPSPSYESTISFNKYIANNFSLNLGIGIGALSFNIYYHFEAPVNSVFYNPNISRKQNVLELNDNSRFNTWVLPFSIQKLINNQNHYYNLEIGIKYNKLLDTFFNGFFITSSYQETDSTGFGLFRLLTETQTNSFISYFFKLGLIQFTKKQHSYCFNLVINYSPVIFAEGWYKFYNLPFESYGEIKQRVNYIGVEFLYGLTLSRRKALQKSVLPNQISKNFSF
jgi:hypothetical protein